jgi:hypothetical protein
VRLMSSAPINTYIILLYIYIHTYYIYKYILIMTIYHYYYILIIYLFISNFENWPRTVGGWGFRAGLVPSEIRVSRFEAWSKNKS